MPAGRLSQIQAPSSAASDAGRQPGRRPLLLAAIPAAVLLVSVLTYRDWLDGPLPAFLGAAVLAAAGAGLVALLAAGSGLSRAFLALLLVVAVLPFPVVRLTRYLHRAELLDVSLGPFYAYGRAFEPTLSPESDLRVEPDAVVLRAPAGALGSLEVRLPDERSRAWLMPRAFATQDHPRLVETLTWRASIERDNAFFLLVDSEPLVIQTASWGLRITARPPGVEPVAQDVALSLENGAPRTWTLRRGGGRVALLDGDTEVWSAPDLGPFRFLRLGQTVRQPEHGGTLRLIQLRFTRSLSS
jgi:hypothetical protein